MTGTFYACAPPESQAPGIPIEPSIRSAEALALSGEWGSLEAASVRVPSPLGGFVGLVSSAGAWSGWTPLTPSWENEVSTVSTERPASDPDPLLQAGLN